MKKDIISIQILRGFAAIAIVFIHMNAIIKLHGAKQSYLLPSTELANAGVDIFFVISGVIMAIITGRMNQRGAGALPFLMKRVTRIYPIYWIYLLLFILGNLLIQGTIIETSGQLNIPAIFQSALLIPNQELPILIIAWTLEFEMFFYLLITLLVARGWMNHPKYLAGIAILLVALGTVIPFRPAFLSLATDPLLLEFAAGAILGYLYLQKKRMNPAPLFIVSILLLGLEIAGWSIAEIFDMYGTRFGRLVRFGLPAFFVVAAFLSANTQISAWRLRSLERLGDASYSLYLSHLLVLSVAGKIWATLDMASFLPDILFAVYLLIACLLWSLLSYAYLEKPLISIFRGRNP